MTLKRMKKILKNFVKFTERHLRWSLFLTELQIKNIKRENSNF